MIADPALSIEWHPAADDLPDEDISVLIATGDGEVYAGFLDCGNWRHLTSDRVSETVTHWAHYPAPPTP